MPTGIPSGGPAESTDSRSTTTTTGTVTLVDGSVLYLTDSTGAQTRVEVADEATITTTSSTTLKKIDQGRHRDGHRDHRR